MRVKHLKQVKAKGRTYYYHRLTGERIKAATAEAAAIKCMAINERIGRPDEQRQDSFAAVIKAYEGSPAFHGLAPQSKKLRRYALSIVHKTWDNLPIAGVEPAHIIELRDDYADRPGMSYQVIVGLRVLYKWAIERGLAKPNPARDIEPLRQKVKHHTAWTEEEVRLFAAKAPPPLRLMLWLGYYTGQRISDVSKMRWTDWQADGTIYVKQKKTGVELWIPIHTELLPILEIAKGEPMMPMVLNKHGRGYANGNSAGQIFADKARKLGINKTFHGLRAMAASKLAEAGCSDRQIAAITGHTSLQEIERYTKGARQKTLAKAAILALETKGRT